jgi:predicted HTH domain antitoxin
MKRVKSGAFLLSELSPWDKAEKLLPEYTKAQFKDLEGFLAEGGEMPPIVISEDCRIIDGYNRWRMAGQLGHQDIECDQYTYENIQEMEKHAIVLNSKRRHLSSIQVARAAARLSEIFAEEESEDSVEVSEVSEPVQKLPEAVEMSFDDAAGTVQDRPSVVERSVDGAEEAGVDDTEKVESISEVLPDVQVKAVKAASKKLRVSRQTVERVKQVDRTKDSHLIEAMEQKKVSLKQAAELAQLSEPERRDVLAEIEKEKNVVDSSRAKLVLNACKSCSSRLKSSFGKLNLEGLEPEKKALIEESVQAIIKEASDFLVVLNTPVNVEEPTP